MTATAVPPLPPLTPRRDLNIGSLAPSAALFAKRSHPKLQSKSSTRILGTPSTSSSPASKPGPVTPLPELSPVPPYPVRTSSRNSTPSHVLERGRTTSDTQPSPLRNAVRPESILDQVPPVPPVPAHLRAPVTPSHSRSRFESPTAAFAEPPRTPVPHPSTSMALYNELQDAPNDPAANVAQSRGSEDESLEGDENYVKFMRSSRSFEKPPRPLNPFGTPPNSQQASSTSLTASFARVAQRAEETPSDEEAQVAAKRAMISNPDNTVPFRVDLPGIRSTQVREADELDSASVTAAMRELDRLNGVDRRLRKKPPNEDDNFF